MVRKGKLLLALDAHHGRDYDAEKRKKQLKAAEKRKRERTQKKQTSDEVASDDDEQPSEPTTNLAGSKKPAQDDFAAFDSSAEDNDEEEEVAATANGTIPQPMEPASASASEAEQDSDVPLSDLENEDLEDAIPHQRMTINNGPALSASRKRVTVARPRMPFSAHNSLISSLPEADKVVPDPNDDLTRELEFYRIAREAAVTARSLLKSEKVPFTRPTDYFAEMVKSDEHMGRVKKKMYDDAASKKAAEDARKLRDARKFGKAVQVAKEQERAKEKRDNLDKIKELKRKRKGNDTGLTRETEGELFESINVEAPPTKDRQGRERGAGPNFKRQKKDQKFGFGGKKRFSKSGDAESSADMRGFSAAKMKGKVKAKRPGKSKRAAGR